MSNKGSSYLLAKYDVSGIQDYIFATNRLRENAGASYQVTRILEEFLVEALREAAAREHVQIITDWKNEKGLRLKENNNIMAEIIYIGGGNAIVLFRSRTLFQKAGELLGQRTAIHCQGLYVAAANIETDLLDFAHDKDVLDKKMNERMRAMTRQPLYSPFPVVEQENDSYQPITRCVKYRDLKDNKEKAENMTEIQFQKREAYKSVHKGTDGKTFKENSGIKGLFPSLGPDKNYRYPEELDQLGSKYGEDSQIAVVHIDGNGMGERIKSLMEEQTSYSDGIPAIRDGSKEIAGLFQNTYKLVLKTLWESEVFINPDALGKGEESGTKMFPLRPILLDGDDFTFLCRADLALPVAAGFMINLLKTQKCEARNITACGGIAFVHSHFPFRAAYSIAEESCNRAKERWYDKRAKKTGEAASCYLDFQVLKDSAAEPPSVNNRFQKRPYSICLEEGHRKDDSLTLLYNTLKQMEDWPLGRLRKLYRGIWQGKEAVEFIKRDFKSRGYDIDHLTQMNWQESPLFDALELQGMCRMDLLEKFYLFPHGHSVTHAPTVGCDLRDKD